MFTRNHFLFLYAHRMPLWVRLPQGNRDKPGRERSRKARVTKVTTLLLMITFYTETWL